MDKSIETPPQRESQSVLTEVGVLASMSFFTGIFVTLSCVLALGWIRSSNSNGIYVLTALGVPLTCVQYILLRGRLLADRKYVGAAIVIVRVVSFPVIAASAAVFVFGYGLVARDLLGIRSSVVWLALGLAIVCGATAVALWATKRGWIARLGTSDWEMGITGALAALIVPPVVGVYGLAAEFAVLLAVEPLGDRVKPLRQFISESLLLSTALSSAGVLILAGIFHAIRNRRSQVQLRRNFLDSLQTIGLAVVCSFCTILLVRTIGAWFY